MKDQEQEKNIFKSELKKKIFQVLYPNRELRTGFFSEIPIPKKKERIKVLFTTYSNLTEEEVAEGVEIKIFSSDYKDNGKIIQKDHCQVIFHNEICNVTMIEIFNDSDIINNISFFEYYEEYEDYSTKSIILVDFSDKELIHPIGLISKKKEGNMEDDDENKIEYFCFYKGKSFGGPILYDENIINKEKEQNEKKETKEKNKLNEKKKIKLIGIHYGNNNKEGKYWNLGINILDIISSYYGKNGWRFISKKKYKEKQNINNQMNINNQKNNTNNQQNQLNTCYSPNSNQMQINNMNSPLAVMNYNSFSHKNNCPQNNLTISKQNSDNIQNRNYMNFPQNNVDQGQNNMNYTQNNLGPNQNNINQSENNMNYPQNNMNQGQNNLNNPQYNIGSNQNNMNLCQNNMNYSQNNMYSNQNNMNQEQNINNSNYNNSMNQNQNMSNIQFNNNNMNMDINMKNQMAQNQNSNPNINSIPIQNDINNMSSNYNNKNMNTNNINPNNNFNSINNNINNNAESNINKINILQQNNMIQMQNNMIPTRNNIIPVQNITAPVQNNMILVQNNMVPVQNNMASVQNNMISAQNNMIPIQNNIIPVQNNMFPIQNNMAPVQNKMIQVQNNMNQGQNNMDPKNNINLDNNQNYNLNNISITKENEQIANEIGINNNSIQNNVINENINNIQADNKINAQNANINDIQNNENNGQNASTNKQNQINHIDNNSNNRQLGNDNKNDSNQFNPPSIINKINNNENAENIKQNENNSTQKAIINNNKIGESNKDNEINNVIKQTNIIGETGNNNNTNNKINDKNKNEEKKINEIKINNGIKEFKDIYPNINGEKIDIIFTMPNNEKKGLKIPSNFTNKELYYTAYYLLKKNKIGEFEYENLLKLFYNRNQFNNDDSIQKMKNNDKIEIKQMEIISFLNFDDLIKENKSPKNKKFIFKDINDQSIKVNLPDDITITEMIEHINSIYNIWLDSKRVECEILFENKKLEKKNKHIGEVNRFKKLKDAYIDIIIKIKNKVCLQKKPGSIFNVKIFENNRNNKHISEISFGTLEKIKDFYEDLKHELIKKKKKIENFAPSFEIGGQKFDLNKDEEKTFFSINIKNDLDCVLNSLAKRKSKFFG